MKTLSPEDRAFGESLGVTAEEFELIDKLINDDSLTERQKLDTVMKARLDNSSDGEIADGLAQGVAAITELRDLARERVQHLREIVAPYEAAIKQADEALRLARFATAQQKLAGVVPDKREALLALLHANGAFEDAPQEAMALSAKALTAHAGEKGALALKVGAAILSGVPVTARYNDGSAETFGENDLAEAFANLGDHTVN